MKGPEFSIRRGKKGLPRGKLSVKQPPPCVVCFTPMKPATPELDVWRCPNHERHVKNGLL